MGMFIFVDAGGFTCPHCGGIVDDFQSKELYDRTGELPLDCQKLALSEEHSGEIHGSCQNCHRHIEFAIVNGKSTGYGDRGSTVQHLIEAIQKQTKEE